METQSHIPVEKASLDEVATTVVMARVTDYFGFFVYAIASALVFPRLFFPEYPPVEGMLLSFLVFALAFLARPIGALLARVVDRKAGRPAKITLATMVFGISTVGIGLLPGYAELGWLAPVALAVFRIGQGLGLGGSWDGITLQLQNAAPEHRQGLYTMIPQLGGPIGFCVAASMFYVLTGFLSDEEFMSFGWRFAFFAVMAVNVVSLFARLRLLTTDFGADESLSQSSPVVEMARAQWRPIVLSACLPLATYALFHLVTVFPLAYAILYATTALPEILMLQLIGGGLSLVTMILSGVLADRFSRQWVIGTSTLLMIALCFTIPMLRTEPAVFIVAGFLLLGLSQGQSGVVSGGRFIRRYAYSANALSVNLSWILGAAFAPALGVWLTDRYGDWAAALYLLSGVIVTFFVMTLLVRRSATAGEDGASA